MCRTGEQTESGYGVGMMNNSTNVLLKAAEILESDSPALED
jgi:hypothetical protein